MNGTLRAAGSVAWREVRLEACGREQLGVVMPFVLAMLVLAGLAFGPAPAVLVAVAPGLPWLTVLFAAVPLARGVAAAERDDGSWEVLRGLVAPGPLLAGKVAALWLWLAIVFAGAVIVSAGLLNAAPRAAVVPAGVFGTLAIAATTVVFGTVVDSSARSGLLGVVLLPAGLPALLAGTQAGTPEVPAAPWLALLVAYDLVAVALAWALYPYLLEE